MGLGVNPTEIAVSLGAVVAVMLAVAVMLGRGLPEAVEREPTYPPFDLTPGSIVWLPNGMLPREQWREWWAVEAWRNWAPDPTLDRWADDGGR